MAAGRPPGCGAVLSLAPLISLLFSFAISHAASRYWCVRSSSFSPSISCSSSKVVASHPPSFPGCPTKGGRHTSAGSCGACTAFSLRFFGPVKVSICSISSPLLSPLNRHLLMVPHFFPLFFRIIPQFDLHPNRDWPVVFVGFRFLPAAARRLISSTQDTMPRCCGEQLVRLCNEIWWERVCCLFARRFLQLGRKCSQQ